MAEEVGFVDRDGIDERGQLALRPISLEQAQIIFVRSGSRRLHPLAHAALEEVAFVLLEVDPAEFVDHRTNSVESVSRQITSTRSTIMWQVHQQLRFFITIPFLRRNKGFTIYQRRRDSVQRPPIVYETVATSSSAAPSSVVRISSRSSRIRSRSSSFATPVM